jgi:hypothetical protein
MPWHQFLLHQQLHQQLNLLTLSDLLAPLPSRMVGLTPQSPQSPVVLPPSPPLPLHPHTLRLYRLPPRSLLSQSSTRRASQSQSCFKDLLNPLPLPLKQLRPLHVPPLYLPKPVRVSPTRLLSRVLYARAKTVILPPLGPLSTRVLWQMAKIIASASVGGRKLVLAVPVLVPRLRLCLVRDWHRIPIRLLVPHPQVYPHLLPPCGIRTTCVLLHLSDDVSSFDMSVWCVHSLVSAIRVWCTPRPILSTTMA